MNPEWVRERCLSFPAATEHVIWGSDLTFKVAGKIFAHLVLEPGPPVWLSFKTNPEKFYALTEPPNIIPAPYMARAQYVALQTRDALSGEELVALLRESYALVVAKLPKKTQLSLATPSAGQKVPPRKSVRKQRANGGKGVAKKFAVTKRAHRGRKRRG